MAEKRRREIDNQTTNITQSSDELNDKEDKTEYPIDHFTAMSFYRKDPNTEYPFESKEEPPQDYWKGPRSTQWEWNEEPKDEYGWDKERAQKRQEETHRKKAKFRVCTNCGTTTTPSWRRSTNNKMLLCNACGLYQKLHGSDRPFSVTPDGKTKAIKTSMERSVCRGCGATQTPLLRRGYNNEWLCSSCGLLYRRRTRQNEGYADVWGAYPDAEYQEYSEWPQYSRNRGQGYHAPYPYPGQDQKDTDYFDEDERFKGYPEGSSSSYYDQDKTE